MTNVWRVWSRIEDFPRVVHQLFTDAGATNVSWVWCPNVDAYNKLTPLEKGGTEADGMDWPIESSSSGLVAFEEGIASSLYKANEYAALDGSVISAP